MSRSEIKPGRCIALGSEENFNILLEIQEVLVLPDILTLVVWRSLRVDDGWPALLSEQQPHIDIEDDQELADRHYSELEGDPNCFHADFFDLDELAVSELTCDRGIIIVVNHEIDQDVQCETQFMLQLGICLQDLFISVCEFIQKHVEDHIE